MGRNPRYPLEFPPGDLRERAHRVAQAERRSLNSWIIRLIERAVEAYERKERFTMTSTLEWVHERNPDWDATGTVAESWYAVHGRYQCRIDRFNDADGGWAYSVSIDGSYLPHAENEPTDSFETAVEAIARIVGITPGLSRR